MSSKSKNVCTSSGKLQAPGVLLLISGCCCCGGGDNGGGGEDEDDEDAAELLLLLSAMAAAETCSIISLNLGDWSSRSSADDVGAAVR